ncbi:unnamed protein product, partial [Rotaria sp. Silwood1]
MDVIIPYLIGVHHIPSTATIIKQFSRKPETHLHDQYTAPLSYLNIYRACKKLKL